MEEGDLEEGEEPQQQHDNADKGDNNVLVDSRASVIDKPSATSQKMDPDKIESKESKSTYYIIVGN